MIAAEELRRAISTNDPDAILAAAASCWQDLLRGGTDNTALIVQAAEQTMDMAPSEELATLRYAAGVVAFRGGDNPRCRDHSQSALDVAVAVGSDKEQARAHIGLSRADFRDRAYDGGLAHAEAAAALAARVAADDLAIAALHMRAEITRARGDYPSAVPLYEQLLAADQAAGDRRSLAMEHYNLGSVFIQRGELDLARSHLQKSYALLDDDPQQTAYTLLAFGGVAARQGEPAMAGRILGAVMAEFERVGEVLDPAEELELASHVTAARTCDPAAYDAGHESGRALSLDQACRLIASSGAT